MIASSVIGKAERSREGFIAKAIVGEAATRRFGTHQVEPESTHGRSRIVQRHAARQADAMTPNLALFAAAAFLVVALLVEHANRIHIGAPDRPALAIQTTRR